MQSITRKFLFVLLPMLGAWIFVYAFCINLPPAPQPKEKIVYVPNTEPSDTIGIPQHTLYQDEYLDSNFRFPLEEDVPYLNRKLIPVSYSTRSEPRGYKSMVTDTTFITEWEEVKVVGNNAFISVPSSSSGQTLRGFAYHYEDSIVIWDQFGGKYLINFKDTLLSSPVFYTGQYRTKTQQAILK